MTLALNMFFMPIGSYYSQQNVNPRYLLIIGAAVAFPCLYLAAFMKEFWAFGTLYVFSFAFN